MLCPLENKHMYQDHRNHDTNNHKIPLIALYSYSHLFQKNQFFQHQQLLIEHAFVE